MISNKCKYRKVNRSNNNINNSGKKINGLMNNNRKLNLRRKYKRN